MMQCVNHPDRETHYYCSKHARALCEECLRCIDPELYCKFRTSCTIWFIHKERERERKKLNEERNGDG